MGVVRFLLADDIAVPEAPKAASSSRTVFALVAGLVGGAAIAAAVGWFALRPAPAASPRPTRFSVVPQRPHQLALLQAITLDRSLAVSPDGRFVVYRAGDGPTADLMVRDLTQLDAHVLPATRGARGPFMSPDGQWVGFFIGGQLRKTPLAGEGSQLITPSGISRGASWGSDGTIVFATAEGTTGLMKVAASGGPLEVLTKPDPAAGESDHVFPNVLPGSRAVLFTIDKGGRGRLAARGEQLLSEVAVLDLRTGKYKTLIPGALRAEYAEAGYIVYWAGPGLLARRFDLTTLEVSGEAVPVAEGISSEFALSRTGTLVYVPEGTSSATLSEPRSLVWVDRRGREEPLSAPLRTYHTVRLSPDGTRIAAMTGDGQGDIWIWDATRAALTRLTSDPADEQSPVWMPDGRRIVLSSNRINNPNIFVQIADGTRTAEQITNVGTAQFPTSITKDGTRVILFSFTGADSNIAAVKLPVAGSAAPNATPALEPVLQGPGLRFGAELSPDGRWLAYHSNESGQMEVYIRPFPDVDSGRSQVSTNGGTRPAWSRDGRELFYLDGEGLLTDARVTAAGGAMTVGKPERLLSTRYVAGGTLLGLDLRGYDVAPDGQRFLMIKDLPAPDRSADALASFVVVVNWFEELKSRLRRE